ncbi:MAG TPA: hypothetical protein VGJ02_02705 [Pyrinomonadaceae bacterium]
MANEKPITVKYQNLVVIWLALLMSQVVFFVAAWFIKGGLARFDTSTPFLTDKPAIVMTFCASAIVFFGLGLVLGRQHNARALRDRDATCMQTGLMLGCALSEIPSILGLILALAFDYPYYYLWIALGAFGVLLHFPRKGNLDAANYGPY